jgi:hypothetical protein
LVHPHRKTSLFEIPELLGLMINLVIIFTVSQHWASVEQAQFTSGMTSKSDSFLRAVRGSLPLVSKVRAKAKNGHFRQKSVSELLLAVIYASVP